MAVKAVYLKEDEGMGHTPSTAWWNSFGSQSIYGDCKAMNDGQKSLQTTMSVQKSLPEHQAPIDLGFSQPMLCAKYPPDHGYGLFSTYGSQFPGRVMLPMATDDGPIYVNPKQYHGIIRRRKSRAKAVLQNRPIKKQKKPYMHLSRHLHAMRRPRGTGGRFLNSKSGNGNGNGEPTGSQSSEVVQLSKEGNSCGSNLSGTEVTSMYSRGDLDHFPINHLSQPIRDFSVIMSTRHSIVLPSKWV